MTITDSTSETEKKKIWRSVYYNFSGVSLGGAGGSLGAMLLGGFLTRPRRYPSRRKKSGLQGGRWSLCVTARGPEDVSLFVPGLFGKEIQETTRMRVSWTLPWGEIEAGFIDVANLRRPL